MAYILLLGAKSSIGSTSGITRCYRRASREILNAKPSSPGVTLDLLGATILSCFSRITIRSECV